QVAPIAMRRCLIERESAFVNRIDFFDLRRMPEAARHGQVGVTAGLGKNPHFGIYTAEASGGGVGEREIPVHKGIAGTSGTFLHGEAAMAKGQPVAKLGEDPASVFSGVGMRISVMQVDLDFSPTGVAVRSEHLEQSLVVLLGGVEVGVDERTAIVVAPAVDRFGVFARPPFQTALLFGARCALLAVLWNDGRFEVVGQ